jgi:membrane protease YdiL (CAAX protease family)
VPAVNAAVREVLATFLAVTAATLAISWAGRLAVFADYVSLSVGVLFLWTALHMAQRVPDGVDRYGLRLAGLLDPPAQAPVGLFQSLLDLARAVAAALPQALRELAVALGVALVVFPLFTLGFRFWHQPGRPFVLQLPDALPSYMLTQLLVVALPEEALFRGYFQGRLSEAFPLRITCLGVRLSLPAVLLQALLFALIHFAVDLHPYRLAVFFPALAFAWLRELRGGIGAAAAFHALCNLLSETLARSWL